MLAALDAAEQEVAAIAGLRVSGRVRLMAFVGAGNSGAEGAPHVKREYPTFFITFHRGGAA